MGGFDSPKAKILEPKRRKDSLEDKTGTIVNFLATSFALASSLSWASIIEELRDQILSEMYITEKFQYCR